MKNEKDENEVYEEVRRRKENLQIGIRDTIDVAKADLDILSEMLIILENSSIKLRNKEEDYGKE